MEITREMVLNALDIEWHSQTLIAIDEANVWTKGNDFILEYQDFYMMVTLDTTIELGLDAIRPEGLRMDWTELEDFGDKHTRISASEFLGELLDWMDGVDVEVEALG